MLQYAVHIFIDRHYDMALREQLAIYDKHLWHTSQKLAISVKKNV